MVSYFKPKLTKSVNGDNYYVLPERYKKKTVVCFFSGGHNMRSYVTLSPKTYRCRPTILLHDLINCTFSHTPSNLKYRIGDESALHQKCLLVWHMLVGFEKCAFIWIVPLSKSGTHCGQGRRRRKRINNTCSVKDIQYRIYYRWLKIFLQLCHFGHLLNICIVPVPTISLSDRYICYNCNGQRYDGTVIIFWIQWIWRLISLILIELLTMSNFSDIPNILIYFK